MKNWKLRVAVLLPLGLIAAACGDDDDDAASSGSPAEITGDASGGDMMAAGEADWSTR